MVAFSKISFRSAGESHGPYLSAILEGIPAGLTLNSAMDIDPDLKRRQKKLGASKRMDIEMDSVEISAGILAGQTTGAPIALKIINKNHDKWLKEIKALHIPRPGHADFVGAIKYGYTDLRPSLERASARETAMRVACGAIAKRVLAEIDITVISYVHRVGPHQLDSQKYSLHVSKETWKKRFKESLLHQSSSPDPKLDKQLIQYITKIREQRDTVGGAIQVAALGLPIGLGSFSQWHKRLDSRLAAVLMSIPSIKTVEIGAGLEQSQKLGSEIHDAFTLNSSTKTTIGRATNFAGGIEAGVSNGMPLLAKCYFKAIPTVLKGYQSVDLTSGEAARSRYERSDICILPRACPVVEAMVALLILDLILEKVGGDSISEIKERVKKLPRNNLQDLNITKNKRHMYKH